MAVKELLKLAFEIETVNGQDLVVLYPAVLHEEEYDEFETGRFELPDDDAFYEISFNQIASITFALMSFKGGAVTVRINDDADLVIPAKDFWLYRSTDTPLTKLELQNDGSAVEVQYFLLGT